VSLGYGQTGKGLQTCWSSVTSRLRKNRDGENRLSLNNWHGYFTCVAEADEVEAALKKFKAPVRKLRDRSDTFSGVERIYLDSCLEIHSVPRGGFLAHFSLREGEEVGGISTALRGATEK
jgi:hypothetical protein